MPRFEIPCVLHVSAPSHAAAHAAVLAALAATCDAEPRLTGYHLPTLDAPAGEPAGAPVVGFAEWLAGVNAGSLRDVLAQVTGASLRACDLTPQALADLHAAPRGAFPSDI